MPAKGGRTAARAHTATRLCPVGRREVHVTETRRLNRVSGLETHFRGSAAEKWRPATRLRTRTTFTAAARVLRVHLRNAPGGSRVRSGTSRVGPRTGGSGMCTSSSPPPHRDRQKYEGESEKWRREGRSRSVAARHRRLEARSERREGGGGAVGGAAVNHLSVTLRRGPSENCYL